MQSVKRRRFCSVAVAMIVVLSSTLALSASLLSGMTSKTVPTESVIKTTFPVRALALTVHDPIDINGNAGFTNASGVVWGSGTTSDPYIIADWDINASTAYGILIQHADVHFIIRNCHVHDGAPNTNNGIFLNNCSNGMLEDNTLLNDWEGILLLSSNRIMLSNNNCSLNAGSILLAGSSNNTLVNNICSNNLAGIILYYSNDNTLNYNNCSSNDRDGIGIRLSSNNNDVSRNRACNNALYGVNISAGSDNHIWNNTFIGNNDASINYNSDHIQACDNGTNNQWETLGSPHGYGNYWSDWTTTDNDFDGIVDSPYVLDGSAGAKDYFPLTMTPTEPIAEFGMMPLVVMVILAAILLMAGMRRRKPE